MVVVAVVVAVVVGVGVVVVVGVAVGVGVAVVVGVAVGVAVVIFGVTMKTKRILRIGSSVIVRTVTHYYTGRIASIDRDGITLDDAAWIASTGRWATALKDGILDEVEPFPGSVWINRGAVVDVSIWKHKLPREQK